MSQQEHKKNLRDSEEHCCGGLSERKDATGEVHGICNEIKPLAEKKTGRNFKVFTALFYKEQVVAGRNYFIKVRVGADEFVHLRVWRMLPCDGGKLELTAIQTNKTFDDDIDYFPD